MFSAGAVLLAIAVALHVAGFVLFLHGGLDFLFNDAENRLGRGADFFAVHGAGDHFLNGISVYEPQEGVADVPYSYAFRYLPSAGFTFGALANALPPWTAYWAWVGFIEVLLGVNVLLTLRFAPDRTWKAVGSAMWLLFTPFYLELFMGQFSFVMASLLYWLGLSLYAGSRVGVFASWTASLLVKTNSLLLLPVAFRTGWLKLALAGVAILVLVNLPYFVAVEGSWQAWWANFDFATSDEGAAAHAGNLGLTSLQTLMTQEGGSGAVASAARFAGDLPIGFAVIGLSLLATLRADPRQKLPLLAIWLCAYFLVFDEVWEHHYVMLLPALVLLTLYEPRLRPFALGAYVLLALPTPYALFEAGPAPPADLEIVDPQTFWSGAQVYVYHLSKVLPVLLLWVVIFADLLRLDVRRLALRPARITQPERA